MQLVELWLVNYSLLSGECKTITNSQKHIYMHRHEGVRLCTPTERKEHLTPKTEKHECSGHNVSVEIFLFFLPNNFIFTSSFKPLNSFIK